jgi:hypothetical protein
VTANAVTASQRLGVGWGGMTPVVTAGMTPRVSTVGDPAGPVTGDLEGPAAARWAADGAYDDPDAPSGRTSCRTLTVIFRTWFFR